MISYQRTDLSCIHTAAVSYLFMALKSSPNHHQTSKTLVFISCILTFFPILIAATQSGRVVSLVHSHRRQRERDQLSSSLAKAIEDLYGFYASSGYRVCVVYEVKNESIYCIISIKFTSSTHTFIVCALRWANRVCLQPILPTSHVP